MNCPMRETAHFRRKPTEPATPRKQSRLGEPYFKGK
jgi:hypothetical protein